MQNRSLNVVLSVPGTWHLFYVARELLKRGHLHRIFTSFPKFKVFPKEGIDAARLSCLPLGEAFMQIAKRIPGRQRGPVGDLLWRLKNETFDRQVAGRLDGRLAGMVYHGLSSAQSRSLEAAKRAGMKTILERSSTHVLFQNRIMEEEYRAYGVAIRDHQPKWLVGKELKEYEAADKILVPIEFVKRTFLEHGVKENKLIVIPLGANLEAGTPAAKNGPGRKLRVLFVGQVGFRKGVIYLLRAVRRLKEQGMEIELVLAGGVQPEFKPFLSPHLDICVMKGFVKHEELTRLYESCDVFVFPSLEEGFGLVILEAMACGLPVITTVNTAGPDVMTDGIEGFVVPIRDASALIEKLVLLYEDRDRCRQMGEAAQKKALQQSWSVYTDKLVSEYHKLLQEH